MWYQHTENSSVFRTNYNQPQSVPIKCEHLRQFKPHFQSQHHKTSTTIEPTSGGNPPYSKRRNRSVYWPCISPQILIGAPNSKSIGCCIKTSLDWLHSCVASCTDKSTGVPGFLFLALKSKSITPSIHRSSCADIVVFNGPRVNLAKTQAQFWSLPIPPRHGPMPSRKGTPVHFLRKKDVDRLEGEMTNMGESPCHPTDPFMVWNNQ